MVIVVMKLMLAVMMVKMDHITVVSVRRLRLEGREEYALVQAVPCVTVVAGPGHASVSG